MPAAALQIPPGGAPPRKRFTVGEVEQMLEAGLFAGQRLELIDGDLIDKMGQNPPHAYAIRLVFAWLVKILEPERVLVQAPIQAGGLDRKWSLPEPDLAVLSELKDEYRSRHPRGNELLLVVEVSDTTVLHGETTKRDLYARAGVGEYWVLDVDGRQLTIHRSPLNGIYSHIQTWAEQDEVYPEFHSSEAVKVATLLP
jgi:Uma2 family endonuclease